MHEAERSATVEAEADMVYPATWAGPCRGTHVVVTFDQIDTAQSLRQRLTHGTASSQVVDFI